MFPYWRVHGRGNVGRSIDSIQIDISSHPSLHHHLGTQGPSQSMQCLGWRMHQCDQAIASCGTRPKNPLHWLHLLVPTQTLTLTLVLCRAQCYPCINCTIRCSLTIKLANYLSPLRHLCARQMDQPPWRDPTNVLTRIMNMLSLVRGTPLNCKKPFLWATRSNTSVKSGIIPKPLKASYIHTSIPTYLPTYPPTYIRTFIQSIKKAKVNIERMLWQGSLRGWPYLKNSRKKSLKNIQ